MVRRRAAAIGPRKDAHYPTDAGILAPALVDDRAPWTSAVTIIALAATLTLGIWALTKKNGSTGPWR